MAAGRPVRRKAQECGQQVTSARPRTADQRTWVPEALSTNKELLRENKVRVVEEEEKGHKPGRPK